MEIETRIEKSCMQIKIDGCCLILNNSWPLPITWRLPGPYDRLHNGATCCCVWLTRRWRKYWGKTFPDTICMHGMEKAIAEICQIAIGMEFVFLNSVVVSLLLCTMRKQFFRTISYICFLDLDFYFFSFWFEWNHWNVYSGRKIRSPLYPLLWHV